MSVPYSWLLVLLYLLVCGIPSLALESLFGLFGELPGGIAGIAATAVLGALFIAFIHSRCKLPDEPSTFSPCGLLAALGAACGMFLALDLFLDPLVDSIFPSSADAYAQSVAGLMRHPVLMFVQVVVLAPIIEELLMRRCILGGLRVAHMQANPDMSQRMDFPALFQSTLLFAVLHFNFVQTLSAALCGLVLGIIYEKTRAVRYSILTHLAYNLMAYLALLAVG